MSPPRSSWSSAEELRADNADLDEQLRLVLDDPRLRLDLCEQGEWTVREQLGHVGEFPRFFARQLHQWLDGDRVVVGRVAEHDADRFDALSRAADASLDELRTQIEDGQAQLSDVLQRLEDDHLDAQTTNVKYGEEPLASFLDRYLVGHKRAHVSQLRRTIEQAGA